MFPFRVLRRVVQLFNHIKDAICQSEMRRAPPRRSTLCLLCPYHHVSTNITKAQVRVGCELNNKTS